MEAPDLVEYYLFAVQLAPTCQLMFQDKITQVRIRLDRELVEQTVVGLCAEQVLELGKQALLELIQKGLKVGK